MIRILSPLAAAVALLVMPLAGARGQPDAEFSTLKVVVNGPGKVTSSPSGINCPPVCEKTVSTGTSIKLTATPSVGAVFSKWTGSCAGTSPTCTVVMTANKTVYSWFVVKPPPPPPPAPGPQPPPPPPPPPPKPSKCAVRVMCFDDIAVGTLVKKAYAVKVGAEIGYGVSSDTPGTTGAFPRVVVDSRARSGSQVGQVGPCSKDFCSSATIYGRLKRPRRWVEVWVGGGAEVSLVARNALFNPVAGAMKTVQTVPGSLSLLRVESSTYNIAYFQIGENAPVGSQRKEVVLDDLRVSESDPNAKPDFALSWTPLLPDSPFLAVPMPGQVTTKVAITRLNGSTGDIDLTASSTSNPAFPVTKGVTATIAPGKAGTSTTSVLVTIKATTDAVVPAGARLIVRGIPAASAGASEQVVGIPLDGRLSNLDFVVTGIEVTQGIQTQYTPYYSDSRSPNFCKIFTGSDDAPEVCASTLFDPNICATQPSLPPRDMANLEEPVLYKTSDSAETPQWLLDPLAASAQRDGVSLVAGRRTIVRVFVSILGKSGRAVAAPALRLYGRRFGQTFTDAGAPEFTPATIRSSPDPWVTCSQRADARAAYTWTLPDSWTAGSIELRARIVPDDIVFGAGGECGSASCVANNALTLDRVGFTKLGYTTITPVEAYLSFGPASPVPIPQEVFADARFFVPGRTYFTVGSETSYAGVIVIDDIVRTLSTPFTPFYVEDKEDRKDEICSWILDALEEWGSENDRGDQTVAVIRDDSICNGVDGDPQLAADGESFEVVAANRPRNSVAHELFHGMGRLHSDTACGGDSGGQKGEAWPPEQRGHIHGIGLDWREIKSGLLRLALGPYRLIAPDGVLAGDDPAQQEEWFDFMSYCASNRASWISDRGWNDSVRLMRAFHKSRGRTASTAAEARTLSAMPTLRVTARQVGSQVAILSLGKTRTALRPGAPSPYRIVARDANGRVLYDRAMRSYDVHDHGEHGESLLLKADVPARRVATIEIVGRGVVVANRVRSASAPSVRVLEPRRGSRAGSQRTVTVRWSVSDRDRDQLRAQVDYSTDGGRHWRAIATRVTGNTARLPSTLFAGSKRARIRVTVSDGFNETAAISGIFTAVARKPSVRIISPAPRQRFPGDAKLYLAGEAYDDRGRRLVGKRLTWFERQTKLGFGERISATGLRPGMRILRLRARDSRGQTANAFVRVRIDAPRPHLLSLRAPEFLGRKARSVSLRVASTIPARLAVSGKTYSLGSKVKAIVVPVRPGHGRLQLALRLTAGGRSNTVKLVIRRR